MRISLPLLCALCALQVHSFFEGTCLRKDPPPGVLVLSPGNKLAMTCCGQVKVNGVKVAMTRDSSNTKKATPASVGGQDSIGNNSGVLGKRDQHGMGDTVNEGYSTRPTEAAVNTVAGENGETVTESENKALEGTGQLKYTDTEHKAHPTTPSFQPTSVSSLETDSEDDYDEDEGNRVTRGLRTRPQWKWNGRTLEEGARGWGRLLFERRGTMLSLTSVRGSDSGKYSCHRGSKKLFSVKVIVADPPERPILSCYKKSPSSKIRCYWPLQQPVTVHPHCYLLLNKGYSRTFSRSECSYAPQLSRCWCALDHNEDEQRLMHTAYLCVTSTTGNATSALLNFTPLTILKPDPPSAVAVHQEEGEERRLKVTWSFPSSWKLQDRYFQLVYELSYRPITSLGPHGTQREMIKSQSYIITDALPGVEYLIQLRTKDEFDGLWSDWSTPVNACSWTAQRSSSDDLSTTMYPFYIDNEGSGTDDYTANVSESEDTEEVWHHILWISGLCVLLSVTLGVYIFRHKERLMYKLQNLSVVSQCSDSSPPPPTAPTPQEGQALVTFAPLRYKEPLPNEVEEEEEEKKEEEKAEGKTEATHFNNTSYFLVQRKC